MVSSTRIAVERSEGLKQKGMLPPKKEAERRRAMEIEKIRNLGDEELKHQESQAAEQLFRLRFQMKLGQNEGVKKLRGLRKDIARMKTIARERELGLNGAAIPMKSTAPAKAKTKKGAR
jgi:large subunit ribosomal protein L29